MTERREGGSIWKEGDGDARGDDGTARARGQQEIPPGPSHPPHVISILKKDSPSQTKPIAAHDLFHSQGTLDRHHRRSPTSNPSCGSWGLEHRAVFTPLPVELTAS